MRDIALLMMQPGRLRDRVAGRLAQQCIAPRVADSFVEGLQLLLSDRPDVAVFDYTLEGVEEPDTCTRLSRRTGVRIIALGSEDGLPPAAEVIAGGAEDYLARPLNAIELVARVRALIRRLKEYSVAERALMQCGDVVVDSQRHHVTVSGEPVELTPKEFDLLTALASRPGELVRREELLADIWGLPEGITSRTLDVHIGRLRRKIDAEHARSSRIVTVPRVGYRLAA